LEKEALASPMVDALTETAPEARVGEVFAASVFEPLAETCHDGEM